MKKKQKQKLIRFVVVPIVLLAITLGFLISFMNIRSSSVHLQSYIAYKSAVKNLELATMNVKDSQRYVGTYTLKELGLWDSALAAVEAYYGKGAMVTPEDFIKLSFWERQAAIKMNQKDPIKPDVEDMNVAVLMEDLIARHHYTGDIPTELINAVPSEAVVKKALQEALTDWYLTETGMEIRTVDLDATGIYVLEGKEEDSYRYKDLVPHLLEDYTLSVELINETVELDVSTVFTVDKHGAAHLDEEALAAVTKEWASRCPTEILPYYLQTRERGRLPLWYMECRYSLNQEALQQLLAEQLPNLDMTPIVAPYYCTVDGKPFSIGDTYIEIDIFTQKMMLYKDGQLVITTDVVTGLPDGHWTWPGVYEVKEKFPNCNLRGQDYDVTVKYWLGYTGDYGIHDAYWRTEFGGDIYKTDGSHGCTNTPEDAMAIFFETAELGTPVVIHHVKE